MNFWKLGLYGMMIREAKARSIAIKQPIIVFGCQQPRIVLSA